MWATLKIFVKVVSSHLFPWVTGSEWHYTFYERQFHHILSTVCEWHYKFCEIQSYYIFLTMNREWVTLDILWKAISLCLFLWPPACEWHCTFGDLKAVWSHLFLWLTGSEWFHILWGLVSSHYFLSPTVCEWYCTFCERHPHHIFSYAACEQCCTLVIAYRQSHHIFPTNSKWVTLYVLWKAVSSYDWQGVSGIAYFVQGSLIISFPYDQQSVSDIVHFVKVITSSHLLLCSTACEWHCTLWKAVSSHLSNDQQLVSDWTFVKAVSSIFLWPTVCEWLCTFVKGILISSFPMTNSLWVIVHFVRCSLITPFPMTLWPIVCEWHSTFSERQSHHISYDQQQVSVIAHFVKGSLMPSFPMTNSKCVRHRMFCERHFHTFFSMTNSLWVTLHILWKAVPLAHVPYDKQFVSDIAHFVISSPIICPIPITDRRWVTVTLHILCKGVSSHPILWPTASEWHDTFCEGHSHHIFSHDQLIASEWHCTFCERLPHHIFSYNQQLVRRLHDILCIAVSSHLFPLTSSLWVTSQNFLPGVSLCFNPWMFDISQHPMYVRKWAGCYIFSTSSFCIILIIDCKSSFQLTCFHLISLFLISRWVWMVVHEVFIFTSVCMLVCRSAQCWYIGWSFWLISDK